ncbi:hypothetical protein L916_21076 [Plasmopara halstedii]|uniref:Uncharacterized protein n=1 Tax=Plasmopara halstedii TaxID=4781 RepID=A0A0P1ALS1_PLAHL|nr:hypothetical protein L916_21076 [Plasmopara halstedii]CEG42274.1 hypothetical protein L916_21076 [Plasmopara halstedii]|eukprot:XP_024578643.1 hypothetical protein L916_21076 [Plasmopara halstedii]
MVSTSAVVQPATKLTNRMTNTLKYAWWCPDLLVDSDQMRAVASSETELLNAAVLCVALSATELEPNEADKQADDRAIRELEMHVRKSPLPHTLQLPIIKFTRDYVLMQSDLTLFCVVRATKPTDIFQTIVGSAVPLSRPCVYRYGGARIHTPFWKRTQRLDLHGIHHLARQAKKVLLLCGHSIGGSIAQLAFCELVYLHLPTKTRLFLEKRDYDQQKQDKDTSEASEILDFRLVIQGMTEEERANIRRGMPDMLAFGFGSPYVGSLSLNLFLEVLQLDGRVVTFVNEFDCIPSVLNVAQSAALVAKTTERFVTITKATKTLLNLLPVQMQPSFVSLAASSGTDVALSPASAYLSMSLSILQNTFQKLRDFHIVKNIDYQYSPCGTYIFLSKFGADYRICSDLGAISKALHEGNDANSTLTGNAILQHLMSAYVAAIGHRSTSIQINASMDFYKRLGVPRNATEKQIRSAYKRLALKWHPDRWANNTTDLQEQASAEEIFKLLAESYEILADADARKAYDAHLNDPPGLKEEFVCNGTINGMTLDEAIATFRDVIDNLSGAVAKVQSRFSSSNSNVLNSLRPSSSVRGDFIRNNHDNIFVPDRIRVSRTVGIGANQRETVMYLEPEEVLADDIASPTKIAGRSDSTYSLRTVSVVGGAVAIGASAALIVSAWSNYSEKSKRKRQAAVVREMPSDCLLLLLEEYRDLQHFDTTQLLVQEVDGRKEKDDLDLVSNATSSLTTTANELNVERAQQAVISMKQWDDAAEDELIEEFFYCAAEYNSSALEAIAEEEYFDCIELMDMVSMHFSDDAQTNQKHIEEKVLVQSPDLSMDRHIVFPPGSTVSTPFGLATVKDWRESQSSVVVQFLCCKFTIGFIQKADILRGASLAKITKNEIMESKRAELAERVIIRYHLDASNSATTIRSLIAASKDGALDSGMRAAGGVVLANSMARTSLALGGAVAAPLTIASILVDIGKEYYDYRKRHTDRKSRDMLSTATEQLMMHDFRLKSGEVVASRIAAAAGAGVGIYSVASVLGIWGTAGVAAGPVGIVAATSAAIAGSLFGYFAGSKAYTASTAGYFTSQQQAKEHIDRLELGARLLFDEFDPDASGTISKEDCAALMKKLYAAIGSVSEGEIDRAMAVIQDDQFEGPVTWGMFWEWVSSEAARALYELQDKELKKLSDKAWWKHYTKYFSYLNLRKANAELAGPHAAMYPSVKTVLGLVKTESTVALSKSSLTRDDGTREESLVLKAQVEFLVNNGQLNSEDAFHLLEQLASDEIVRKEAARKTIVAIHEGLSDAEPQQNLVCDGFGSCGKDMMNSSTLASDKNIDAMRSDFSGVSTNEDDGKKRFNVDERLDVMCSLMSSKGLQRYLLRRNILLQNEASVRQEDLHCLALMTTPISHTEASSN